MLLRTPTRRGPPTFPTTLEDAVTDDRPPLIDLCGIVFDAECWEAYLRGFADGSPDYLRVFAGRFALMTGLDAAELVRLAEADPHGAVDALVATKAFGTDIDVHAEALARDDVRMQVIVGLTAPLPSGGTVNDRVAGFAARHPERLQAWAGLSLGGWEDRPGSDSAAAELRRCVEDLGMRGAALSHFIEAADPLGEESRAVYAEAERLDVPIWIHTGHNLSTHVPLDVCTWRELDAIARDYPRLRIVAGHGGWPWIPEMISVCQRHANVYLEFSSFRPVQMGQAGSGWEPLLAHGTSTIRSKVLFGSIDWIHAMTPRELADEVQDLPISPRVARAWLHDNAARMLRLDSASLIAGPAR